MLERYAYLNTGSFGPLPRLTIEAMREELDRDLVEGRSGQTYFRDVLELRNTVRDDLAHLIGATPASVALTDSTTDGCNISVASLELGPADEIVTTDIEHPGLEGALRVSGARVRVAAVRVLPPLDALAVIEAEITPRTRLIALSHVAWTTGAVLPVEQLAGRGIPVLVDGAQAVGAIPVDVRALNCDFYTVSAQKWLLGPDSTGCLYVRPEGIDELRIPFPSYLSWNYPAFTPKEGAQRFEPGWIPPASLRGLAESLAFATAVGEKRFTCARRMAERCRELLAERTRLVTEADQASLVTFAPSAPAATVVEDLGRRGVIVRDLPGLDWVRASIGFWTNDDDLERLVAALQR